VPLHVDTPLIESHPLSLASGRRIFLKLDALQPSGSFKLRGIGHACEVQHARGARGFVSSSGGNAGLAVAYAGRRLGVPVTVVVPESSTSTARALLAREQAEVIVHGASWQEANELALARVGADDAFIHPFDDPLLWHGHASMIDEVMAAGLTFDAVVVCVGGGGLMCGVAEGLRRHGLDDVPIVAVETSGAASLRAAVDAGELVTLDAITSVATSLGARRRLRPGLAVDAGAARAERRGVRRRGARGVRALPGGSPDARGAGLRRQPGACLRAARGARRFRACARHRLWRRHRHHRSDPPLGPARACLGSMMPS
jgi:L-serine/L-threonine ammonia-lyase